MTKPLSVSVTQRLSTAASRLRTADPTKVIKPLLERTFALPEGDPRYAANSLTPGAAPLEPSFSELEPGLLRFTVEPLGPEAGPMDRRDEATREMRRLVRNFFGHDALHWFDEASEDWRDSGSGSRLHYGAFFGSSYDSDGLASSKVFYETRPDQVQSLPLPLFRVVTAALRMMPNLVPLFTSIACRREHGSQRMTFLHRGVLRLAQLAPLMSELGLAAHHSGILQTFGLALGGRFDLPDKSVLIALEQGHEGPELELYVLLGMIPDLPRNFLDLLAMGLRERPRELNAMLRWLGAFTPERGDWPGNFSVLSVKTSPHGAPRVSLYLRPVEFEIPRVVGEEMPDAEPALA
jgi:hypothetical protein